MIDLKDRPDVGWNVLFGVSAIAIAAALWFQFRFQVPVSQVSEQSVTEQRNRPSRTATEKLIAAHTWNDVSTDALAPAVLNYLSTLSEKNAVQLTSFRTDKTAQVATLDEAPFVAIVEGGFPDVLAFAHALEASNSKLAVNLIELSASDAAPGHVTATFGLLGFIFKEPK